ncbi:hypothetical protein Q7M48_01580 [Candidatus Liberibacter asiaticus]|uniref:Uncharacterized protein n=6 Tax=Liberibacter asiaticus TaxID=34021 RepID=C6XEX0_LIBAP|nr:hypothetical protein [Candidatus Liberibacter asiaticus]ACT56922.1 hypothetical protein CLIBASIA_01670 [Candidatus Liberibacter asiaticus str. psy62]AGH16686.1 hypothetical protein WSI_01580 [Candidatus Liberibacter asiaticus str. gxpsy]ALK07064.1 hypothetical protein CD16_01585 [Candidatus Liberibacter asiaticus]ASK52537.1 hypothetical protein B2I23_01610 [Candidatus Liberibacter asiaticus]AWL13861.1 hypothetical protein DIC79_01635 [Candidatus Liberibacter asiaticus]
MNISEINKYFPPNNNIERKEIADKLIKNISIVDKTMDVLPLYHQVRELTQNKASTEQVIDISTKVKDVAVDVAVSMIPIYGTYREFKKGNYGWGIVGAISDAALLIPVVGYGARAAINLVRGGSIALKAGTAGTMIAAKEACTIAQATEKTAKLTALTKEGITSIRTIEGSSVTIKSESIGTKASISSTNTAEKSAISQKITTNSTTEIGKTTEVVEESISKINSQLSKSTPQGIWTKALTKADPALESIYQRGKIFSNTIKNNAFIEKLAHTTKAIDKKIPFIGNQWRDINTAHSEFKMVPLSDQTLFRDFQGLCGKNIDNQFILDLNRASFIFNGKKLARDNSAEAIQKLMNQFAKNPKQLQLISSYANQSIFADSVVHLMQSIPEFAKYASKSGSASKFTAKTLTNGEVAFTAKYTTKVQAVDKIAGKPLKEYGLKISGILSPDKATELQRSFYLK